MKKILQLCVCGLLGLFLFTKGYADGGNVPSVWDATVQKYKDYVPQEKVQYIIDNPDSIHKTKDAVLKEIETTQKYLENNAGMSLDTLLSNAAIIKSFGERKKNLVTGWLNSLGIANLSLLVLDGKAPKSSVVQPTPQSLSEKTDMKTLLAAALWNTKDGSDHVTVAKFKKSLESLDAQKLKKMQDDQRETVKTFQTQNTPPSDMKMVFQSTARALVRLLLIGQRLTSFTM